MPRQNPFSRKTATTYALLHRPQDDPRIHDDTAPDLVFHEVSRPTVSSSAASSSSSHTLKIQRRDDLEAQLGPDAKIRANEGEAAEHGVFYDDTSYDYMQHLKDLGGSGGADATWLDAPTQKNKGKGKQQNLEDALRDINLDGGDDFDTRSLASGVSFANSIASSKYSTGSSRYWGGRLMPNAKYQNQQDVPDAISGFQPDMDPRLREVLEALEDEAYVDDEDDVFAALTGDGAEEVDQANWEDTLFDDEANKEGWESDQTEKPVKEYKAQEKELTLPVEFLGENAATYGVSQAPETDLPTIDEEVPAPLPTTQSDGDWLASFAKSKGNLPTTTGTNNHPLPLRQTQAPSSIAHSSASFIRGGKKRKGALTNPTTFSMTSSSLARTEPLNTLDARFDRIAAEYMDEDDAFADGEGDLDDTASVATATTNRTNASRLSHVSGISGMSRASRASAWSTTSGASASGPSERVPQLAPAQFDRVLDDFLDGTGASKSNWKAARRSKKNGSGRGMSGLDQLEEIRRGLGPARVK